MMSEKKSLRDKFSDIRAAASDDGDEAARRLARAFMAEGPEATSGTIVAGYWPIRTELDVRPLMDALPSRGVVLALPSATDKAGSLMFRQYQGGFPAARDAWDIPTPPDGATELTPDIVLVPGLAFDASGHRLGYGAGNYDRTLERLRGERQVIAVGVGFAEQVIEHLPVEAHDAPLDWIITPEGVVRRPA